MPHVEPGPQTTTPSTSHCYHQVTIVVINVYLEEKQLRRQMRLLRIVLVQSCAQVAPASLVCQKRAWTMSITS